MIRRLFFLLLLAATELTAYSQTMVQQINAIKRDTAYVSAEATEDTQEKAEEAARVSLQLAIKESLPSLDLEAVKAKVAGCQQLSMPRGSMFRVFVYVRKNAAETIKFPTLISRTASVIPSATSSSTTEAPKVLDSTLSPWQQLLVGNLLKCANVDEVINYMERMETQKKVTKWGTKSDKPHNPQKAMYVYFDQELNLNALLGREEDGKRLNYMTNQKETLRDHSNKAFLWFTMPN